MKKDENQEENYFARLKQRFLPDGPDDTKSQKFLNKVLFNAGLVLFGFITILLAAVAVFAL